MSYMKHERFERKRKERRLRPIPTAADLGEILKRTIKSANLTQEETATLTGIPRSTLLRKMHGGTFNFEELSKISQITGKKLSAIVSEAEALADKENARK